MNSDLMSAAAGAVLDALEIRSGGVLGLSWGDPRRAVYDRLTREGWTDRESQGPDLFVILDGELAGVPVVAQARFGNGLHALTVTLMVEGEGLGGALRTALQGRMGPPEEDDRTDGGGRTTWESPNLAVYLDHSAWYSPRITIRRAEYPERLHRVDESFPVLEDLKSPFGSVQAAFDGGDTARGVQALQYDRLLEASCPSCGLTLGTGHFPGCRYEPSGGPCTICDERRGEPSDRCLLCRRSEAVSARVHQFARLAEEARPTPNAQAAVARATRFGMDGSRPTRDYSDQVSAVLVVIGALLFLVGAFSGSLGLMVVGFAIGWFGYRHFKIKAESEVLQRQRATREAEEELARESKSPPAGDTEEGELARALLRAYMDDPDGDPKGWIKRASEEGETGRGVVDRRGDLVPEPNRVRQLSTAPLDRPSHAESLQRTQSSSPAPSSPGTIRTRPPNHPPEIKPRWILRTSDTKCEAASNARRPCLRWAQVTLDGRLLCEMHAELHLGGKKLNWSGRNRRAGASKCEAITASGRRCVRWGQHAVAGRLLCGGHLGVKDG